MIVGECIHQLLYRMKQHINREMVSISYDMMVLLDLTKKILLSQIEDKYPFVILYD